MAPDAGQKKRRGLGGLLSSKATAEPAASYNEQPPPVPPKDTRVTVSAENTHITPIVNDGKLPDVDAQRNLAVNERTGEVLDDDTGEVLTVTTTTTTVTKTETRRSRSPQPPPNGTSNTVVEERRVQQTQQHLDPASALHHPNTSNTSQPTDGSDNISPQTYTSSMSNDMSLQQSSSNPWPLPKEEAGPPKTAIENLKSAAAGLQDVRNSLKGTNINDVRDSLKDSINTRNIPLPRRNPARSSRAQQVPTIKSPVPPDRSPAPPVPPIPVHATGQSQWQAPWPEPEDEYVESEGLRKRKSLSTMPATFSPESSGQIDRAKSPRLLKRAKNKKMGA
jgi:hypothetical protein